MSGTYLVFLLLLFLLVSRPRLKGVSDFARREAPYLVAELTEVREPVGGYVRLAEQVRAFSLELNFAHMLLASG